MAACGEDYGDASKLSKLARSTLFRRFGYTFEVYKQSKDPKDIPTSFEFNPNFN